MSESQPRLSPLDPAQYDDRSAEALAPWGGDRAANVFKTLAHHIDLFEAWTPFAWRLLLESALTERQRELVILRVSWRVQSEYEWGHHVRIGRKAGLSDEEIIQAAEPSPVFADPIETAVVRATDELIDADEVSEATWSELATELSDNQLVELVLLAGSYRMLAGALKTLRVAPDRELAPLGAAVVGGGQNKNEVR
ncbi:carboxymuconolactone decarboxylase family protein [Rhodococcus rhodochrous]|uniref:carboxymuconolactone decarboxylase family protein n=1 Tax=Rhodococcus rhodochrous TaxID=1829 RepID=UPI000319A99A|nr:carboxymuconolactone decarboxylase family protein [Rhodococcus rhodochrous]